MPQLLLKFRFRNRKYISNMNYIGCPYNQNTEQRAYRTCVRLYQFYVPFIYYICNKVTTLLPHIALTMAKSRTSFSLSAESLEMLKKLAEKNNRSQANMLEILISDAAEKMKIKPRKS